MATHTLYTKIVTCNDSTLNWTSSAKILLKGEIGIENLESGAPKFKVGDGESTWGELPYATLNPTEINSLITAASHSHSNKDILDSITAAFTTEQASKLSGIAANAQVNVLESVKVNNEALTPDSNKAVNITVPTAVSQLSNDSGYITSYTNTTYDFSVTANSSNNSAHLTILPKVNGVDQTAENFYIKGAGSVAVTTNADGDFIVTGTDTVYTHPTSGVTAGTYTSVTVDANGHVTAGSNPTTLAGYGITDAASITHTHGNADITGIDASKIESGKIDIARLPAGALERLIVVADDTARFALTAEDAQLGDTVKVESTGAMYFIKALPADEEDPMDAESYFERYTAGAATSVPWSGVTDKPSTFTPSAHTHETSEINGLDSALAGKATAAQGAAADTAVQSVKITSEGSELKVGTNVVLPAYPTTLPASDVYDWAKAASKPTYTKAEVGLANVTNDRQIVGKASDTVENHVVTWGADGYTVKDSGFTIGSNVPANAVFTDTTYSNFVGADSQEGGVAGLVPAPSAGDEGYYLRGDGTWAVPTNTDVNVTVESDDTHNFYIAGTTSNSSSVTGTLVKNADVTIGADGKVTANGFVGSLTGNASSASTAAQLTTSRNLSITGGATAAATAFNGTADVALNVTSLDAMKLNVASGDTLIISGGAAN